MPLSAFESMLLTFAIVGTVHLIVTLLSSLENNETDHREIMRHLAKYKFLHENKITVQEPRVLFYH